MNRPAVLVVEDEALIADDLERTLRRLGYHVPEVVAFGERAIEAAGEHAPDLVLMDIKLAGALDGISAARTIRERYETPIVFLTSHADPATLARAGGARPDGYVTKPFVERDLRVAIEVSLHKGEVERAMRERERWFATTLRSIGDGVVAADEHLLVTFMNVAAEEITGWSSDAAVGRPLDDVIGARGDDGATVTSVGARARQEGVVAAGPPLRIVRHGEERVVEACAAPIVDPRGRVRGVVEVLRDVTDRVALEARVSRSERLAALGTLAAGLCHEINNPLTSVLVNIDVATDLFSAVPGVDEGLASLRDAQAAAVHIAEIIEGMRTFATPHTGKSTMVDLADVLDGSIRLAQHVVQRRARLVSEVAGAPRVHADPTRLRQVFVNLLVNAAQAMPDGDPAAAHQVRVSLRRVTDTGEAEVVVADDGVGMPADVLRRVFDPFFTTKPPGQGLGLGLSICVSVVEGLGGTLTVSSTPGRGTTVTVRLPGQAPPQA